MKKLALLGAGLSLVFLSCKKEQHCGSNDSACRDSPPIGEMCTAAFSRWFYDENSNSCELIGYSGCSMRGFATQAACEQCACD